MGTFSDWSYTNKCTVWEPTFDEWDQPSSYTRTVFDCSFRDGTGLVMDAQGERFQPRNTVYLSSDTPPVVGSYLVTGEDVALTPPSDAQVIRSVMAHDPSLFNEGTQDVVVMTQ